MYDDGAKLENVAVREPVSHEIMTFAARLAERAETTCAKVCGKLQPVMISSFPIGKTADKQPREYPPLFEDLREKFLCIEAALNGIEDAMTRTEL